MKTAYAYSHDLNQSDLEVLCRGGRLRMKTDYPNRNDLIQSDLEELCVAATKLAYHAIKFGDGLGVGTAFFKFLASFSAIYLLILDRTNWRTSMLTSLLIPYIFLSLPNGLFTLLRGDFGKWVALVAVLRLFCPRHFPDWLEMPRALVLLFVVNVAPGFFTNTIRDGSVGVFICLVIAFYLLQAHIRASGGFRNSFTKGHGISNSLGIILLLLYPCLASLVLHSP